MNHRGWWWQYFAIKEYHCCKISETYKHGCCPTSFQLSYTQVQFTSSIIMHMYATAINFLRIHFCNASVSSSQVYQVYLWPSNLWQMGNAIISAWSTIPTQCIQFRRICGLLNWCNSILCVINWQLSGYALVPVSSNILLLKFVC